MKRSRTLVVYSQLFLSEAALSSCGHRPRILWKFTPCLHDCLAPEYASAGKSSETMANDKNRVTSFSWDPATGRTWRDTLVPKNIIDALCFGTTELLQGQDEEGTTRSGYATCTLPPL